MLLPARALIILLLSVACVCSALSQTPSAKNEPNSSVTGKVTIKGKPAPGILVGAQTMGPNQSPRAYKATTNQDGVYRINNVANGTYRVAPAAPALVLSDLANPEGQTVVVANDDAAENVNFDLVRGGVITGKVTDVDGRPLIEMNLNLLAVEKSKERPGRSLPYGFTDDRGVYRLFGIPAGRYKVLVNDPRRYRPGSPAYLPMTYYPDAQAADKAGIIDVAEGAEVSDINIKVGPSPPSFKVSGRVVDESGQPVPKVDIGLSRIITYDATHTSSESGDNGTVSDQQGRFRLMNVPAGKYELSIYMGEGSDLQAREPSRFDVIDSDVTDLVVKMKRGALISGNVVFEGKKQPTLEMLSRLAVMAYIKNDAEGISGATSGGVKPDGSFVIGGLRNGTITFGVGRARGNGGFTLVRVERDGVVLPNGLQLQGNEHISGLRLFVTHSSGSISGVIKISNGALPAGGRLFVQVSRPGEQDYGGSAADVDARGHFLIEGLAAGNYELLVLAYGPTWRRPVSAKQQVTVTDGAVNDLTVTLDLTQPIP